MIRKVAIRNYRLFREFDLDFSPGINVLVGNNDTGKSTLIEAINLALTGRLHDRSFLQELSPYLVNMAATHEFIEGLQSGRRPTPPAIIIEIYLEPTSEAETLLGNNNLYNEDACGIRIQAKFSQDYSEEYDSFVDDPSSIRLVPTEYYRVDWLDFGGRPVSARSVPAVASVIDPTTIRLTSGVDYHLQNIIRTHLEPRERVELSREYRSLREKFAEKEAVKKINERLKNDKDLLTDRELSLGLDISHGYTWESGLAAHVNDLPFHLIGKGEQNALKMLLAIGRKANDAHVVLIEEPENHVCFASLRKLISRIEERCAGKQVIIATHSTYVLNKLGLSNLILLGSGRPTRVTDLPTDTIDFFKKLAGFDTLRLVLSLGAILVEGPSDELVVQRGYRDVKGKLPIEDGIDVISVGLSHKRFLDLAIHLKRRVWVVTDNDGKTLEEVEERFSGYRGHDCVSFHIGTDPDIKTLEPQIVDVNDLDKLNTVLKMECTSKEELIAAMLADKTGAALAIFESPIKITMPKYISDVYCD